MSKKALVLSSGGVDSTTCVSVAVHELGRENVATVSIFYGQKHRKELDAAQKVADFYHQKGVALVVIKDGKNGAYVSEKKENGEITRDMIPGYPVKKVVDTVGAGDGFAVGVLSGLLKGLPVTECAKRGNAIGSIQVQHRGDNEGLPTEEILQTYMVGNIQK